MNFVKYLLVKNQKYFVKNLKFHYVGPYSPKSPEEMQTTPLIGNGVYSAIDQYRLVRRGTSETASGTSESRRGARGERRCGHRPMLNKFSTHYYLRLCIFVMLNKSHVSISLLSFHSHISKKILAANADVCT